MIEELTLMEKGKKLFLIWIGVPFFLITHPNSEDLHAQEYTHMNDIAYHVCPDLKKKIKKSTYRPSQFSGQKGKQTSFFRPYVVVLSMQNAHPYFEWNRLLSNR